MSEDENAIVITPFHGDPYAFFMARTKSFAAQGNTPHDALTNLLAYIAMNEREWK